MPLTPAPDLGSNRRLLGLAAAIVVCVWVFRCMGQGDITSSLGDTDDAMRLVRVHDLLAGQGWYDQNMLRLQPPHGSVMHWSRLLDGALAGMDWTLARFVSLSSAEWAMRFAWPLLWIAPAVASTLVVVRRLNGRSALLIGAVLMVVDVQLYNQFRPGRIDHHNVQIVMALVAVACAVAGGDRRRWAALAGAASAMGLAIGIEALAFQALVGVSYALAAGLDPARLRVARAYGLSLGLTSLAVFTLQTPPGAWTTSVCDAMGWNLVMAMGLGGFGLAAVATWAAKAPAFVRLALMVAVGAIAAAAYLAADPACLHGPMAAADPRLGPIWMDRIRELRSWPLLWRADRDMAIESIAVVALDGLAAAYLLGGSWRERDSAVILMIALVVLAGLAASQAVRMMDYAFWFGVPVVAAALGRLIERRLDGALVWALAAGLFLAPQSVSMASGRLADAVAPLPRGANQDNTPDPCVKVEAYAPLAKLPPGIVLAPIDLGPFILAHTQSAVLAAPYHRMVWGILSAHEALSAPTALAQAKVRALNVRYIVDCPSYLSDLGPTSLAADLRRHRAPAWLTPLSTPKQTLQIYRVEPAGARSASS